MRCIRIVRGAFLVAFFCGQSLMAIGQNSATTQAAGESLMLNWPASENWDLASNESGKAVNLIQLVHKPESLDNWTELATMMSITSIPSGPMRISMDGIYREFQKTAPNAKLAMLEQDSLAKNPWILFTVESGPTKTKPQGESQIYHCIRGRKALYVTMWAIKAPVFNEEQKDKWGRFFKTAQVVNK